MVEVLFRRYDKNGDGVLNYDEMPDNLKAEKDKWDANKDGLIDLKEFKEYMKGRMDQIRAEMGAAFPGGQGQGNATGPAGSLPLVPIPIEEDTPKRTVYRAGNLPKELPSWFAQYDTDGDGQIGLYEWKKTGRPLNEFQQMDRNGDGFLTVEEVLSWQAAQNKGKGGNGTVVAGGPSPGGPGGNFGAPPGGNFSGPPGGPGGNRWNGPPGGNPGGNRGNGPPGGNRRGGPGGFGPNNGADNQTPDGGQRGGRRNRQNGGG
jgi:Ca2+-binding EF-hand superfamily protein